MSEIKNGNGGGASSGNTKDEKNIVRIAAVIHVLFTLIDQALTKTRAVVPQKINRHVLNAAIAISLYFEKQSAIICQVIFVNLEFPFYRPLAVPLSTKRVRKMWQLHNPIERSFLVHSIVTKNFLSYMLC